MSTYDTGTSTALSVPPTWLRVLLGVVFILGGVLVLGDVALATFVSTLVIGITAIAMGAFEIIHAFWSKGWGGFLWQVLLGILYIIFGSTVINQPVSGALILTLVLGLVFLASGIARISSLASFSCDAAVRTSSTILRTSPVAVDESMR